MVYLLKKSSQKVLIFPTIAFVGIFGAHLCQADITVYNFENQQIVGSYRSYTTELGPRLDPEGFEGLITFNNAGKLGCNHSLIEPPPPNTHYIHRWILLVEEGDCNLVQKVRNAQNKQYDMVIVFNNGSAVEPLRGTDVSDILIPSLFVSLNTGLLLKEKYQYFRNVYVVVGDNPDFPFDINTDLLIPFAVVVAVCFITMISFMICKCFRDRRRARRHRLPYSSLRKIPIEKFFSKTSPYETCAICLDDYVDGEKLRILPCCHAYHTKCVDPWLTRNRRVCPICKRKVFAADEPLIEGFESDSDTDNDERTPLIRSESSQPTQTRQSHPIPQESFVNLWQGWRSQNETLVAGTRYGSSSSSNSTEFQCHHVLPASAVHSINSINDNSHSADSIHAYSYPGTSSVRHVQVHLSQCNDDEVVQSQNEVVS